MKDDKCTCGNDYLDCECEIGIQENCTLDGDCTSCDG